MSGFKEETVRLMNMIKRELTHPDYPTLAQLMRVGAVVVVLVVVSKLLDAIGVVYG